MPRGKGKRWDNHQENQRDKTKIQNDKKRKREENKQCDKQAKRRKIEWLRDLRPVLRSSGKKVEFPKNFSERKLNKIRRERKCLRSNSKISDKDQPGPSGRSRVNYINTMIELENRCSSDLDDFIDSSSSGSSVVEVIEAPINDDYRISNELHRTRSQENVQSHNLIDQVEENSRSNNLINQEQENSRSNNLIDQVQENSQSSNQIDQAQRNDQFDCITSDSFQNSNGCQQTDFKALIEIRRLSSNDTDNITQSENNTNIDTTKGDIESFTSTELVDRSNSNKYASSAEDQKKVGSEIQGHINNMESGDHSHNLAESLNDSSNYWNFNSNRDNDNFYFGSAKHDNENESNIANFSFASHSNNLNDDEDFLTPDGDSMMTVNDEMDIEENNTVHLQEGEYNRNNYSNELNRNTMQINDLSKCLLYPTDTLVYNNNNQPNSGYENVNNIENIHQQNSFAYYDNSKGAFLKSSSLQNNSSTSQSLKNTWGSIKNLLSRVSRQKTNDNQQTEEENDPEGPP